MCFLRHWTSAVLMIGCLVTQAQSQRGVPVVPPPGGFPEVLLDSDPYIQQLVQSVDSARINSSLQRLEAFRTRYSSTDSVYSAKNWLVAKFEEYGYSDIFQHQFTASSRTQYNVVVTKPGVRYANKYVLLIAHYDATSESPTTLAPGVNDNGSGIAVVLEVARILAAKRLDYSIRFICFAAEEQGLLGSRAYVQNIVVPQNHDIRLVINLDEIGGYRGYTNTMVKVERDEDNNPPGNNSASAAYTDTLATLTRTYSSLTTTITNAYGSDYMSFEDAGYVITGFYEGLQTPHYHRSTDNFANVDPPYVYQITRGTLAGIAYFGGIQRKFLTILHTPHGDTQDTSSNVQIDARLLSSASVTGGSISYRTNWNPTPTLSSMNYVSAIGDTLLYRGWILKQPYTTTVAYYLRFTNGDTVFSTFPSDTTNLIVFAIAPDTVPPAISHAIIGNRSYLDQPFEIQAAISDVNGIATAWLEYRANGGSTQTATMTQLSDDVWRGYLTGPFVAGYRVEYVVTARDASFSGNTTRIPASGWYSFRVLNSIVYDFEITDGGFTPTNDWQWGTIGTADIPAPPVGQKVWGTNLGGDYSNNTTSLLESPVFDLNGKSEIVMTFKHFYRIEPNNDGGNVWVSVDSGSHALMVPEGGYPASTIAALGGPGYSANSYAWREARFNIQSLANHRVRFRFKFATDWLTSNRGWYVDDVRLDYLDSAVVSVRSDDSELPTTTQLFQNYPNPFNPSTNVRFTIADSRFTSLKVYDVLGREVATLVNEVKERGSYSVRWDASNLSGGVYFARLQAGSLVDTKKVVLLK